MAGDTHRLLLVEDEVLIQMVTEEDLQMHGFEVVVAGTATAALAEMERMKDRFAAAIVDIGLPDRGGDVLAAELRELSAGLPIVIVSGYERDVLNEKFGGDPLVGFVRKPYRSEQLLAELGRFKVTPPA